MVEQRNSVMEQYEQCGTVRRNSGTVEQYIMEQWNSGTVLWNSVVLLSLAS